MSTCKFTSSTTPRVLPQRHEDGCRDDTCAGCAPCPPGADIGAWNRAIRRSTIQGGPLATPCWLCDLNPNRDGYSTIRPTSQRTMALTHRLTYEVINGPIEAGKVLDHLCRVRNCINPDHLEPVTNRENVMRSEGWAPKKAAQTHCIRGHEFNDTNTRTTKAGTRECRPCNTIRARERRQRKAA